ncbi:MAG: hypothetical protein ACFUZC_03055 [Chthoniobacteraceae bacterium]
MGVIHFSIDKELVELIRRELDLHQFIETGTFRGDTVAGLVSSFEAIDTVEFSPEHHEAARVRFAGFPHVRVHQGNSAEVLQKIVAKAGNAAALFWLDAHWCAADHTAGEKSQCPLLGELKAIGKLDPRSVIMIDDARYFLCPPPAPHESSDWPGLNEVLDALEQCSSDHCVMVLDDVIVFCPRRIHPQIAEYARRNGADWLQIASKAGTFDRLVAEYQTDWSAAANKAAKYDEAVAECEELKLQLAGKASAVRVERAVLEAKEKELQQLCADLQTSRRREKKARHGIEEIRRRPLRFLLRCWTNRHPLYPGELDEARDSATH